MKSIYLSPYSQASFFDLCFTLEINQYVMTLSKVDMRLARQHFEREQRQKEEERRKREQQDEEAAKKLQQLEISRTKGIPNGVANGRVANGHVATETNKLPQQQVGVNLLLRFAIST